MLPHDGTLRIPAASPSYSLLIPHCLLPSGDRRISSSSSFLIILPFFRLLLRSSSPSPSCYSYRDHACHHTFGSHQQSSPDWSSVWLRPPSILPAIITIVIRVASASGSQYSYITYSSLCLWSASSSLPSFFHAISSWSASSSWSFLMHLVAYIVANLSQAAHRGHFGQRENHQFSGSCSELANGGPIHYHRL